MGRYVEMSRHIFKSMLFDILGTLGEKRTLDAYEEWEISDIKVLLNETSKVVSAYMEQRRRQESLGAWMEK